MVAIVPEVGGPISIAAGELNQQHTHSLVAVPLDDGMELLQLESVPSRSGSATLRFLDPFRPGRVVTLVLDPKLPVTLLPQLP